MSRPRSLGDYHVTEIRSPSGLLALLLAIVCQAGPVLPADALAADVPAAGRPNVLFIAVDDLRPMLGCYGDPVIKTPNIDRLARRGAVFTRAYCQVAMCGPSRASLLTGLRLDSTGEFLLTYHRRRVLRSEFPGLVMLPEQFKRHGYHTQAFGKIYHDGLDDSPSWSVPSSPGRTRKGGQGEILELVDEEAIAGVPFEQRARIPTVIRPRKDCRAIQSPEVPDKTLYAGRMTQQAVETLAQIKDEPFFLAVGYRRPHLPFVAPQRYFDLYPAETITLPAHREPAKDAPIVGFYNSWIYKRADPTPKNVEEALLTAGYELRSYQGIPTSGPISDRQQKLIRQAYMACVSYVDAQIGRLLGGLEKLGLADNTIVVLWGDHGWHLGEHGTWSKLTNYEWATRVPLIIAAPGSEYQHASTSALAELVDVYPTLCELAGLDIPKHVEGTSLAPVMRQPNRPWKTAAFSQFPFGKEILGRAIRTDRYRYVEWSKTTVETIAVELYDHQTDPGETVNAAGHKEMAEITAGLHEDLQAGWKACLPSMAERKSPTK